MIKIGINGFGRIGRNYFRGIYETEGYQVVAINDLGDAAMLAHLLKYDSVHNIFEAEVRAEDGMLWVNDRPIKVHSEKNPGDIPWASDEVDIVIEATGIFRKKSQVQAHLDAGARKVIITAPAKDEDLTIVMGVNEKQYDPLKHHILSNASCTTNCLAPVAKVIDEHFGIVNGLMTTVHSYTNDQRTLDLPHEDYRRARAAVVSIIPTTTGAAKAVSLVLPQLAGKLNGFAMRVPTPNVSVVDLTVNLEKTVTVAAINQVLRDASEGELKGILGYTDLPLVSKDFNGNPLSSIVDGLSTMVMDGKMVKILSWYDNEWGYSSRLADLTRYVGERLHQDKSFATQDQKIS
ncbi:MAG: glyceraldehyde-3-phosphate dehydrogenase [delta proteobacterium ML8_F1]|nr:MAG: glyceraldehyde-3-phosphate dehydrogenase [delta proteobacterium ML8_F1]